MSNFDQIDPKLKEEINRDGWEGDKEGGAAVFVGKKEEVEKARERMEGEGRAENLESYIRLHKEIVVPKDKLGEFLDGRGAGKPCPGCHSFVGDKLVFIDKEGNVAQVSIDTKKIGDLGSANLDDKIKELGFRLGSPLDAKDAGAGWTIIINAMLWRKRELEKEAEVKKKKEFDF